ETFTAAEQYRDFAKRSWESLKLAEPVAAKQDMKLAVENHKDWRTDELLDILRRLSSRHLGVTLDTGNSIALLEDPMEVIKAYAPHTFTTHFKDMGVAEGAATRPTGTGARRGGECAEMPALRAGDVATIAACGYARSHSRKRQTLLLQQPHLTHLTPPPRPAAAGLLRPTQQQFARRGGPRGNVELQRLIAPAQISVNLALVVRHEPNLRR